MNRVLERLRWRLRMIWLGLTLKPMQGADDAGDGSGDGDAGGDGDESDGGDGDDAGDAGDGDDSDDDDDTDDDLDPRAKAKIGKVNREAANLRRRLKELEPLARKARELEDANKTEQQKLEERATKAEGEAKDATNEAMKLRVALRKGLTETQAKRLVGETEEELEKDADELLDSFKTDDDDGQAPKRRPRERLRPGAAPGANSEPSDPAELAKGVPRW